MQVSSEQSGEEGNKAVDGKLSTRWHTKWGFEDTQRYFIIELNMPRFLTQIDYYPPDNQNGRLKDAEIYVSMNGTNWTLAGNVTRLADDKMCKTLQLDEPTIAKYVKIVGKHTYGAENRIDWFMSAKRYF